MHKRLLSLSILVTLVTIPLGLLLVFFSPAPVEADCGSDASSCKTCHEGNQEMPVNTAGSWHTDHAFSDFCASCHLGDKGVSDKDASHQGMRPSVLADPKASCESCHASNYEELAAKYKDEAEKQAAAPAVAKKQLPPPNSNNTLFIWLNIITFAGLVLLVWAWEKGPLAKYTVRRPAPLAGGQAAALQEERAPAPGAGRNPLAWREWSPYLAGAGLGVVGILALWISGQPLGSSGAFMIGSSSLLKLIGSPLSESVYFKLVTPPQVTWQVMLVLGVPVGAFLSAWWGRSFRFESAPARWIETFGPTRWKRWLVMFLGGMILEFGASMAGGCTSGLAIAGTMQLAGAGFLFIASLFVTGIITTKLLYGRRF